MANFDLDYEGSEVQDILDTGKSLEDDGYIFLGTATPSTIPGTPTERVAYVGGPGTYNNFGTTVVVPSGSIVAITYSGSAWSKTVINASLPVSTTLGSDNTTIPTSKAVKDVTDAINNKLGEGYLYAGIATAATNPGTPTVKVFYLARQAGTYTNFGGLTLTEGVNILKYNGTAWSQEQLISIADIRKNPLIGYYECDTAGGTAAKTVAATGYVLPTTGGSVKIKMANRNTVANATLNINSTGAKPLFYNGVRAGVGNTWDTNEIVEVFYDGTNYQAYNVAGSNGDGVFDISAYNLTDGQPTPYVDLSAALGTDGANVPQSLRKGGMSVKFIQGNAQSSDNKYVQYRLLTQTFSNSVSDWQEYINTEYKSYNYTKNDYTNSLIKEIHIEGTKDPNLKYFIRSCKRFYTSSTENAWMYFAIQSYNPSTEERVTICEMGSGELNKSGVFSKTQNGYKTTILVTIDNQNSNDGCVNSAPYSEDLEINDICWGDIENAPIISLYNKVDDYQLLKDLDNHSSFITFISSVPTDKRNKPTIAVYKNVLYIFKFTEIRQYTNLEWTNLDNWASTNDIPHYERICNVPYVSLFIKDLRLTSGNLGENYVYYVRSCYIRNNNLYIGIKARNIQDNTEIIAFDNEVIDGYNKIIKNNHVWECIIDTSAKVVEKYTSVINANNYTEDLGLKDFCFSQTGHLLIDLYNAYAEQESSINSLENSLKGILSDSEYTVKQQIPYTLTQGYYDQNAEIQYDGSYKSVSALVPCKKGDIIRFDNFYPNYTDTTIAFWIYDSERHAVGSRIDKNQLTVNDEGIVYYEITREGAAYLGISTNKPDPGALYYATKAVTDNFISAVRNNSDIGKVVDVLVFAGQSNMAGRGITTTTYPEKAPTVPENYGREFRAITDPTKLYPIVDPFGKNENNPNGLNDGNSKTGSLVPAFVNAYYETTRVPVIAVSATEGALNITQFQPDGTKLQDVISRFNACVQYLENNMYTIRHKYVVWCQGENDASRVSTYESLFENVLNALLTAGAEKVLMIRIGRNSSNTAQDGIVNLQTQMAKTHKDIILISTGFAKYAGEGTMKDTQHFYQFAYNEVGRQAGHNAGCWANYQIERTQYDSMHKVDANIPELYISDKCY